MGEHLSGVMGEGGQKLEFERSETDFLFFESVRQNPLSSAFHSLISCIHESRPSEMKGIKRMVPERPSWPGKRKTERSKEILASNIVEHEAETCGVAHEGDRSKDPTGLL